jgi:hypothetical protein
MVKNHVGLPPLHLILIVMVAFASDVDAGSRDPKGKVYEVDVMTQDGAPKHKSALVKIIMKMQKDIRDNFSLTGCHRNFRSSEKNMRPCMQRTHGLEL